MSDQQHQQHPLRVFQTTMPPHHPRVVPRQAPIISAHAPYAATLLPLPPEVLPEECLNPDDYVSLTPLSSSIREGGSDSASLFYYSSTPCDTSPSSSLSSSYSSSSSSSPSLSSSSRSSSVGRHRRRRDTHSRRERNRHNKSSRRRRHRSRSRDRKGSRHKERDRGGGGGSKHKKDKHKRRDSRGAVDRHRRRHRDYDDDDDRRRVPGEKYQRGHADDDDHRQHKERRRRGRRNDNHDRRHDDDHGNKFMAASYSSSSNRNNISNRSEGGLQFHQAVYTRDSINIPTTTYPAASVANIPSSSSLLSLVSTHDHSQLNPTSTSSHSSNVVGRLPPPTIEPADKIVTNTAKLLARQDLGNVMKYQSYTALWSSLSQEHQTRSDNRDNTNMTNMTGGVNASGEEESAIGGVVGGGVAAGEWAEVGGTIHTTTTPHTPLVSRDISYVEDDEDEDDLGAYDLNDGNDTTAATVVPPTTAQTTTVTFTFTSNIGEYEGEDDDDMSLYQLRADSEQSAITADHSNNGADDNYYRYNMLDTGDEEDMGVDSSRSNSPLRAQSTVSNGKANHHNNCEDAPPLSLMCAPVEAGPPVTPPRLDMGDDMDDDSAIEELRGLTALFGFVGNNKKTIKKRQAPQPVVVPPLKTYTTDDNNAVKEVDTARPSIKDGDADGADGNENITLWDGTDEECCDTAISVAAVAQRMALKVLATRGANNSVVRRKMFHALRCDNPMWWCWWRSNNEVVRENRPTTSSASVSPVTTTGSIDENRDPLRFWYQHLNPVVERLLVSNPNWTSPEPFIEALQASLNEGCDVVPGSAASSGCSPIITSVGVQTGLLVSRHNESTIVSPQPSSPDTTSSLNAITFGATLSFHMMDSSNSRDAGKSQYFHRGVTQLTPSTQLLLADLSAWQQQHRQSPATTSESSGKENVRVEQINDFDSFSLWRHSSTRMTPHMGLSWLYQQLGGTSSRSSVVGSMPSAPIITNIGRDRRRDIKSNHSLSQSCPSSSPKAAVSSSSSLEFIPILNLNEGRTFLHPLTPSTPPSSTTTAVKSLSSYLQEDDDDEGEEVEDTHQDSDNSPFSFSSPFVVTDPSEPRHQHHHSDGASTSSPCSISAPIIAWIGGPSPSISTTVFAINTEGPTKNDMVPYLIAEGAYTGRMRQLGTYNHVKTMSSDCMEETLVDGRDHCPSPTSPLTTPTYTIPGPYRPIPLDEGSISYLHHPPSPPSHASAGSRRCLPFRLPARREQRQQQRGRRGGRFTRGLSPSIPSSAPQYHLHFGRVLREKERGGVVEAASSLTGEAHTHIRANEVPVIPLAPAEVLALLDSLRRQQFKSDTSNNNKSSIVAAASSPSKITLPSILDVRGSGSGCLPVFCVRKDDVYGLVGGSLV